MLAVSCQGARSMGDDDDTVSIEVGSKIKSFIASASLLSVAKVAQGLPALFATGYPF
jgi:hypothetical protein